MKEVLKRIEKNLENICNSLRIGSCVETSKLIFNALKDGYNVSIRNMPNQNHVVVFLELNGETYVIDPLIEINYGVPTDKKIFRLDEHKEVMEKVTKKKPFLIYMGKEIIYQKIP